MTLEIAQGIARHVMGAIGSVVAAKGYTDGATFELITGGVLAAIAVIWSVAHKQKIATKP